MPPAAVLIAGAGPTGLILALLLTRLSIPFRIVDQAARSGTTSRAIVVHARTLELYRQLGLAGAVAAAGQKLQSARFTAHGTVLASAPLGDLGAGLSPFPFVLALPQDEHERVLEARLEELGARVERGVELVGCVPREGGCEVTLRVVDGGGEESVQVAYVVGCDGAHSAVRRLAGITMAGGTYLQRFFVADVDLAGDWAEGDGAVARDNLDICIGGNDFCIVLPFGRKGAVRLIGIVPKGLEEREDLDFEHVRESVRANTKLEVQRVGWFATYKVHHRVADRFREGRVFLCGDACHLHSPAGGQGMNTGLGDAMNLGWKIAAELKGGSSQLLDTYEIERLAFAKTLVSTTDWVFGLMTAEGWLGSFLRRWLVPYLLPVVVRLPGFGKMAFRRISQILIEYRNSPLSLGAAGSVRAGDRLPWAQVEDGGDNHAPLSELRWQVHVYGELGNTAKEVLEAEGIPVHTFGWTAGVKATGLNQKTLYLIRPDGHIGCICGEADLNSLKDYIRRWEIRTSR